VVAVLKKLVMAVDVYGQIFIHTGMGRPSSPGAEAPLTLSSDIWISFSVIGFTGSVAADDPRLGFHMGRAVEKRYSERVLLSPCLR